MRFGDEYIEIHAENGDFEGEIYDDGGLCLELHDCYDDSLVYGGGISSVEEGIEIAKDIAYPDKIDYWKVEN